MVFDELSFVLSTGLINGNPNPVKSKQAMDAKKIVVSDLQKAYDDKQIRTILALTNQNICSKIRLRFILGG
jgi:hypothetical protein